MKKGALRKEVKDRYGNKGFTKKGDIKMSVLHELKKNGDKTTRKRANYAINIRRRKH